MSGLVAPFDNLLCNYFFGKLFNIFSFCNNITNYKTKEMDCLAAIATL